MAHFALPCLAGGAHEADVIADPWSEEGAEGMEWRAVT